jgi:hypothetical protein
VKGMAVCAGFLLFVAAVATCLRLYVLIFTLGAEEVLGAGCHCSPINPSTTC